IRSNGIDFWVLEQDRSFDLEAPTRSWVRQYPEAIAAAQAQMRQGTPVLKTLITPCMVKRQKNLQVLSTACILARIQSGP
ncbi:MAG TPA: hypothetical protein V6C57_19320, partial [Coleofasciculaceae cyanobacterium]